ncbi:hypothetical protein SMMN14_05296 [Sphaerulina musiva]
MATTTPQIDTSGGSTTRKTTLLTDSTHSSASSSASRYALDEGDTSPILLYKYRGGLQTSSQKDLCAWLDKDENFRVTKKEIPRLSSYIEVKRHDLFLPNEQREFRNTPNYDSSLASVKLPTSVYWSRLILGGYENLYIVSPEGSPASSVADDESRRTSPTTTWGQDSIEDVHIGAPQDGSGV